MIRADFTVLALLSLTLVAALAAPPVPQVNYAALPPPTEDVIAGLQACKVPLTQAVETAVKATGSVAKSATIKVGNGTAVIEVVLYGNGKCQRVIVDGSSGELQSTTELGRFPGEPVSGAWTETPTGLRYYDLTVGTGKKPVDPLTPVTVHYTGWLIDGTKFDSSVDRGQPYVKALRDVVPGLSEGVSTMQVGGKRKLIIPAKLGYGNKGFGDSIPPRAILVFDVELLDV